jgi:hypothetical protein
LLERRRDANSHEIVDCGLRNSPRFGSEQGAAGWLFAKKLAAKM